ncbi:unnamed protein product [Penicillium olsonii]|uniref:Involucrin repeat protein n=1 Tax=Penicillium olsonii TaxID=99116 RepID=A0A9W4HB11_PENOL|nr:unnamed protein product [Penicillium olsonii]
MFKALMGSRSSSDVRSKSSRKDRTDRSERSERSVRSDKSDTRSISSRKSSRGDDRDRGLGDLDSYPSHRSRRGPASIADDSVASFVTAEPEPIDDYDRYVERTPKRRDSDRESKSSRRRERDRSGSPDRERRRRGTSHTIDDDFDRERDRRERRRTHSGDPYVPPIATHMPSSAPAAQFPADGSPGFSQYPMQYDNALPSAGHSPEHDVYDPHVQQQFPGQFPDTVAQPYRPPNPNGAAADYYGDQGQSVEYQPGIRPARPAILPNTQSHLMAASPSANPPPEPSSMGQTGAAAAYFDDEFSGPEANPPVTSSSRPPKPSKPSKPSAGSVASAAAAGAATYGVGNITSHADAYASEQHSSSYNHQSQTIGYNQPMAYNQPIPYNQPMSSGSQSPPKPSHSHHFSEGAALAAAGAAGGYLVGHHHSSSSPEQGSPYPFQNYEQSSQAGMVPYASGNPETLHVAGPGGHATHAIHNPGFYPHGPSALVMRERQRGAVGRFVDFWRDPEGVGRFEDYTETIGVCKYCFAPGTTSVDAPRQHHYHARRRRNSDDRHSSGSSRVSKSSRYNSSEDEGRRRKKSNKSSWLPGMLAGYGAKSLFTSKEFDDSYSIRSGRVQSSHGEDDDRRSYTSRGVARRSGRSPHRDYHSDSKRPQSAYTRSSRSRSRSSSRSGRHSFMKEAAIGAAVGGAAYALAKTHDRSRSSSPEGRRRRKDSTSSSSMVNVSRPSRKKSVAGNIGSFFTSSSENRKKRHSKKRRGFFSFNGGSSSSSLDNDLAFGDGFHKKSPKSKKKDKKGKDVDAALVGLGATANRLAGSSPHGPGRSAGQMYTAKSRHSNYASSATNDDEWVDESEDQSSVSSALAFGASSPDSSDSGTSKWGWRWGSKKDKKKKDKRSSGTNTALAVGAGALGAAAISSARHHHDSKPTSDGALQYVYPMPTSDPSRFDAAKMNPQDHPGGEPTLVRPGPIPLQQPQPFAPVSQAVYTTQGALPGTIPAHSAPAVPVYGAGFPQYRIQDPESRDAGWAPPPMDPTSPGRGPHRRSDSFPVYPTQEPLPTIKRRSTGKDQASVSFNLTEEQAERERHLNRRDKSNRDDVVDQPLVLYDREEELAREEENHRRERRRMEKELKELERRRDEDDREKESSSWVGPAAAGLIGAAATSAIMSRKHDDNVSETSSRHSERREKRIAERYRYENEQEGSLISAFPASEPIDDDITVEHREEQKPRSPRRARPAQVYDDYAEFYAPEELRHSPDVHTGKSTGMPTIVEVEPASERRAREEPIPEQDYSYEPYENVDRLPWPVPRLNFIEPTPPHSVNGGSVRDATAPSAPVDTPKRDRPTGSRVSWGEHETHEYEVPSCSEQDPLDYESHEVSAKDIPLPPSGVSARDVPLPASEVSQNKNEKSQYGNDIEFAATIAAATAAAGFDPSFITNDPSYHTRTSPPGSEDEAHAPFTSPWAPRKQGFVEEEELDPKSKDISSHGAQDKDELFFDEPKAIQDRDAYGRRENSIAQEVIEHLNGKRSNDASPERDVDTFSMPGGFDTADPRDLVDDRSVVTAPVDNKPKSKPKPKKSRLSQEFEIPEYKDQDPPAEESRSIPSAPEPEALRELPVNDLEASQTREPSSMGDSFSVISAPTSKDETSKSKSRKSRRSGDEFETAPQEPEVPAPDDSFSVISAPVSKDETSKSTSRKSRRSGDDFEFDSRERSEPQDMARSFDSTVPPTEEPALPKKSRRSGDDFEVEYQEPRDDSFSVISAPTSKEETSKSESRKSRRSGDDFEAENQERELAEPRDDSFSVISAPVSKDETSKSKSRKSRRSGDDFEIYESREPSESREVSRSATSTPAPKEESKHRKSRRSGDDYSSRSREVSLARDDRSILSAPVSKDETSKSRRSRRSGDDFDISRSRDVSEVRDDSRSVISESGKSRRSRRSDDFDPRRDAGTPPPDDDNGDEKKRRRKRRSKHEGDSYADDYARSITTDAADDNKSERRRHRHRSSRDFDDTASITSAITDVADDKSERRRHRSRSSRDFDDNASVTSSPARISESRERGKDKKDKSGGFLRSLFGSQVSAPAERVRSDHSRDHSRSSSLDKRSSREGISEAGGDDERRRRKKRSSKSRTSSNGDELDAYLSDKEKRDPNLEEYRSSRQRKEEERRHKYEDIVDSGRKRDSAKDFKDDDSFLSEGPGLPADRTTGASGPPEDAAVAAGLDLNEVLQQRPRSRSISPPNAEKTLDLTPKSRSRPASPDSGRHPAQRRHSVAKSTESPTAVPLHFRRPPTSPGLSRAVPVEPATSPGSPSQQRHRRPGSVEFRNSREIRPLWLVERHSAAKGEPEEESHLPSLPSSKGSSRVPSIENLKDLNDDEMKSWEHVDLSHEITERPNVTISTDQANEHRERDLDLLDSQQATPTAEHHDENKGRPHYEFHSPSELLQDPASLDEITSKSFERLPSVEGSVVGDNARELSADDKSKETDRALDALEGRTQPDRTPTQEKDSFNFNQGGFANIVDAAAIAAVKEHDERAAPADKAEPGFGDIVNQAVAQSFDDRKPEDNAGIDPAPESSKDLVPEMTEQPVEEPQPEPSEPAADNIEAPQLSKKQKKKKGKKNQAQEDVPQEPTEEQSLPTETPVETPAETPFETPAETPTEIPENVPEPQFEPLESSREIQLEPEVALAEGEATPQPEPEASAAEVTTDIATEPQAAAESTEPAVEPTPETEVVPTELEQAEDTASSSKKSKKDKKKKKKGKNAATEEPTEDVATAQSVEESHAVEATEATTSTNEPASQELPVDQVHTEEAIKAELVPATEEPAMPAEREMPAGETSEPVFADANENQTPEAAPRSIDDTAPVALDESNFVPETPKEETGSEENFQEAVEEQGPQPIEEQISLPAEEKEPTSEPATEERQVEETPAEATESKSEKRKNKKKKNRKSAVEETVDEPVVETESPQPATEEAQPEQSVPISGEALPSDLDKDVELPSEPAAQEPTPALEQEAPSSETVDPSAPVEANATEESSRDIPEDTVEFQPEPGSVAPVEDSAHETTEPALATQAEPEPEAETEVAMTPAQKKKAKKDKKKKGKESQASVPEEEVLPESAETAPPANTAVEEAAKETAAPEEAPMEMAPEAEHQVPAEVEAPAETEQISVPEQPAELEKPQEESASLAEPAAETVEAETPLESNEPVEQEKTEEAAAEPEVPMTAAEKKKAKKNKKKQQKQEEDVIPAQEDTPPTDLASQPGPEEVPEASRDLAPAEGTEAVDPPSMDTEAPSQDTPVEATEPEVAPAPEDAAPTDVPPPLETEAAVVEETSAPGAVQPGDDAPVPADDTIAAPLEADVAKEDEPSVEAEVPMTAAEKKKAKKNKKKKNQSAQPEEEPTTETEPSPAEDKSAETPAEAAPEAEAAHTSEAGEQPTEPEVAREIDVDATSADQQTPDAQNVDAETSEPSTELPAATPEVSEQVSDVPASTEAEPQVDETATPTEGQEEQKVEVAAEESPEKIAEEKPNESATEPAEEEAMTPAQKRKAKKDKKKKSQSAAAEDEQVAPSEEATAVPAEEETKPAEEETQPVVAEDPIEPAVAQESEQVPEPEAAPPVTEEEPPKAEEATPAEETTQPETPIDSEAAEVDEFAGMNAAQRKKAKREKKKRQSLAAEQDPAPAEEEPKAAPEENPADEQPVPEDTKEVSPTESLEPVALQEAEPVSLEKDAETPAVEEEAPKAEDPSPAEDTVQPEAPVDEAAAEVDEFAGMTAAQRKKAKKEKKRQSLAAEQQSTPIEEEPKAAPSEEQPVEDQPAVQEATDTIAEESTERSLENNPEPAIAEEEAPKPEEPTAAEEIAAPETPAEPAAAEVDEFAGMTAAQRKKAKKEKKRQSLAAEESKPTIPEDEAKPAPSEEEQPASTEAVQDVPSEAAETAEPSSLQEVEASPEQTAEAPAVEEASKTEEVSPVEAAPTSDEPADAAAAEAAEEAEFEGMTPAQKRKAKKDKKRQQRKSVAFEEDTTPAEEPKPDQDPPAESNPESQEASADLPNSEETPKDLPSTEEVSETPAEEKETEEPANTESEEPKPAAKSVEQTETDAQPPTEESSTNPEVDEYAGMTAAQKKKAKKAKKKGKSADPTEEAAVETPETQPETTEQEQVIESEQHKTEDLDTTAVVSEDAPKDEVSEAKEPDSETKAADETSQPDAVADTPAAEVDEYAGMTAAQKKKAKKAKKRQSKGNAADDSSAPPTEPATPIEENSVEKVLTSTDTDAPGLPATATSPAEHDGKDQSHDETNASAQETTSTDNFMSSQVETSTESPFLDFPPQPVLERSVISGELEEVAASQEGDVAPSAQEPDVVESSLEEKAAGEVGEEISSVPEAGDFSEKVEDTSVDVPVEAVPEPQTEEAPLEEEAVETAVSKKQKKKNKKNKKQEEETVEAPANDVDVATGEEEKEMSNVVPSIEAEAQPELPAVEDNQAEPTAEPEPVVDKPTVEEPAVAEPTIQPEPAIETTPIVEEPVVEQTAAAEPVNQDEPVVEKPPIVEEPAVQAEATVEPEPVVDETSVDEPTVEEPVVQAEPNFETEPIVVEPTTEDSAVVVEPAVETEPVVENSIIDEPTNQAPSTKALEEQTEDHHVEQFSADQPVDTPEETKELNVSAAENIETPILEGPAEEETEQTSLSKKKSKKDKKKERQLALAQEQEAVPRQEATPALEALDAPAPELEPQVATENVPEDEKPQDDLAFTEADPSAEPIEHPVHDAEPAAEAEHHASNKELASEEASAEPSSAESQPEEAVKTLESTEAGPQVSEAELPTENPEAEASAELVAVAVEEPPSAPKKMSKKEKKKAAATAAAAAAAASLEEDNSPEQKLAPNEPAAVATEAPDEVAAQPLAEEQVPTESKDEPEPMVERSLEEPKEIATPEHAETLEQKPVESSEPIEQVSLEALPDDNTQEPPNEPASEGPSRKMSKKEKKKAKKDLKQELIEPTSTGPEEPISTVQPDVSEVAPEQVALDEPMAESVLEHETIQPESLDQSPVATAGTSEEPKSEDVVPEGNQHPETVKDEAVASQETADVAPTEAETLGIPTDVAEKPTSPEQTADEHLDKATDNGLPELSTDKPHEAQEASELPKKMSKKDKRKAKKNAGIVDETPEPQPEQATVDVAETPAEIEKQTSEPAIEAPAQSEPEPDVAQAVSERELLVDSPLPIEEQPTPEPEFPAQSQQAEPEPAQQDPILSHKAAKKKAKKAQKAEKSLDIEPATEQESATAENVQIAPFEDEPPKAPEATSSPKKSAQDDDDWPAIDWEQKVDRSQQPRETDLGPEPVPTSGQDIIAEFEDSSAPEAQENEALKQTSDHASLPLSKKDKKKAKKDKIQSQEAVAEKPVETFDRAVEAPPRTTTPGGSKIANIFPGLERGGYKKSVEKLSSLNESHKPKVEPEASRELAAPVAEAAPSESKELPQAPKLPSLEEQIESAIAHVKSYDEIPTEKETTKIPEDDVPTQDKQSLDAPVSFPPDTREDSTQFSPEQAGEDQCELRRSPSIHGRHQATPRTWSLDDPSLPATGPSPPRSVFGGPSEESFSRPRTPLDTIAEQEPREGRPATKGRRGTPRLEMKAEHVLPRPQTPVRKFTDNAFDRESWPTDESKKIVRAGSRETIEVTKTPEQGFQILKPSTSSGRLRRTKRSVSGDLRAASQSQPSSTDLDQLPSSSSYDPVTDKGKRPMRNMSDVYEGWGETPSSPRSPSRPPSVRRRRSMQHLQDIETRIDQLISENRLLIAARDEAEDKLRNASVARRKSDRALNTRDGDLRDRDAEVEQLKNSVEWLQKETSRLTNENESITASNAALAAAHSAEVSAVRDNSAHELAELRAKHTKLSSKMDERVRQEIESALAQKDIELRRLRTELEEARDKVKELQQQISASVHDNALVFRDEEYFDAACQKLCGHVQSWVVRFSKHNDKRRCRPLAELKDEKIADRFDNALLDGSDPDAYLSDRVRRRDVFMSVVMTMVWEYIFTRYLFGMDREQRQKLKSLEKQLGEVGPSRAVHRWRATTLTLLSRRPAFAAQRENDTEAVTLEIFQTLSRVLPPPSHVESQLLDNLRKIMRVAVNLSLEMRTQLAEFIMLPPLQPEYDINGDLARQVYFNAALMNERSGLTTNNEDLESQQSVVRIVLFPLVVKKGNDVGEGDDEVVVCPAQVLIARPLKDKKFPGMSDRMSVDGSRSVQSFAPSVAPSSMMDMSNVI